MLFPLMVSTDAVVRAEFLLLGVDESSANESREAQRDEELADGKHPTLEMTLHSTTLEQPPLLAVFSHSTNFCVALLSTATMY